MIIDFDDFNSLNSVIKAYTLKHSQDFTSLNEDNIIDKYSLSKCLDKSIISKHREWFNEQLHDSKIYAGHFTKIHDLSLIDNGLDALDCADHLIRLQDILDKECFNDRHEIDLLKDILMNLSKYLGGDREKRLSFFYPISNRSSCLHYSEVIGGEVVKFNRHRIPKIYDLFSKVGISVLICATVPFEDLSEYYKGKIIDNIIRMVLSSEKLWKECIEEYCFEIQIDANLERTNIEKILILDLKEQ